MLLLFLAGAGVQAPIVAPTLTPVSCNALSLTPVTCGPLSLTPVSDTSLSLTPEP